mgnify:CR=1 FL=1
MAETYTPIDYSQFDVAKKDSPSETYTPVDYSQFDVETKRDDGQQEGYTEEGLNVDPDWLSDARTIYQSEENENWKGSDKKLSEWFKNRHSELGWDISSMGSLALRANELDNDTKRAWVNSMDMYENLDSDIHTFGRAVKNLGQDPFFWVPTAASFGIGGIARVAGGKAAATAARFTFKQQLQKALLKKGVTEKAAKEFAEKGASKGVTSEALRGARKRAAWNATRLARLEGAAWGSADLGLASTLDQQFHDEYEEPNKHIDYSEVAKQALIGGVLGLSLGALPASRVMANNKAVRKHDIRLRELEDEAAEAAIGTKPDIDIFIGARTPGSQISTTIRTEGRTLQNGGTAKIDVGSRKALKAKFDAEYVASGKKGKKKTPAEIDKIYNETRETVVRVGVEAGLDLKEVGKRTGIFKGKKTLSPRQVERVDPDGRRWYHKALGYVGRKIGVSAPEEVRRLHQLKEAAGNKVLRGINHRLVALKKAVEQEFNVKEIGDLEQYITEDLDKVLRGDQTARDKYIDKTQTLDALDNMRYDINELQEELLKSGMIKEGSELETKIKASMDGKSGELWLTRQFKIFDDPKTWGKTLKDNPEIRDKAAQSLLDDFLSQNDTINKIYIRDANKEAITSAEKKLLDDVVGQDGAIQQRISVLLDSHSEEEFLTAFDAPLRYGEGKAGKIFKARKDLSGEIRALFGEYKNPLNNYANSLMKINQTLETYKYQEAIADLVRNLPARAGKAIVKEKRIDLTRDIAKPEWMGTQFGPLRPEWWQKLTGRKTVEPGTGESLIPLAGTRPDPSKGMTTELADVLPLQAGIRSPYKIGSEAIATSGLEGDFLASNLKRNISPLQDLYATKEVADAIVNGNNIAMVQQKHLQKYLLLQGHTRAAKTVWSPTAVARNFLGAGWMAAGAGYFRPGSLKGIVQVFSGLTKLSDAELRTQMEKGVALGYLQSGIEMGAYREALQLGSKQQFWNGADQIYKGTKTLKDKATSINTSAVKLYQSMDDMWKQMAFINEAGTYKKILADQFGEAYPDTVVKTIRSGDGKIIDITNLDLYAAKMVSKHMQNYGGVPQFVRYGRLLPAADFLAFTTELMRTQVNIYGTALRDIAQGSKLLAQSGGQRGGTQLKAGMVRAASVVSMTAAGTAVPWTANSVFTNLHKKEEGQPYTKKQALEFFNAPYDKGDRFIYKGDPKNGEGTRVNVSYINPWAKFQSPIHAGLEALQRGEDVDGKILDSVNEAWFKPLIETFGPSMFAESIANLALNRDKYGNELYKGSNTLAQDMTAGVLGFLEPFDPGLFRTARNIYGGFTEQPFEGAEYAMKRGKAGRKTSWGNELWGLTGVKPQKYDIKIELGYRTADIKRKMGEAGKIFTDMIQQQSPMTAEELVESYDESLSKQFSYAKDMFDVISHAKSLGMTNKNIYTAITKEGFFPKFMDKKILHNLINKGIFIPPPPLRKDVYKWREATKKRGGAPPPLKEAQRELMNIYNSYKGARTGTRSTYTPIDYSQFK